jgi:hypothetical protein
VTQAVRIARAGGVVVPKPRDHAGHAGLATQEHAKQVGLFVGMVKALGKPLIVPGQRPQPAKVWTVAGAQRMARVTARSAKSTEAVALCCCLMIRVRFGMTTPVRLSVASRYRERAATDEGMPRQLLFNQLAKV